MKIAAYGCADDQTVKLGRILKLSRSHPYQLVAFDPNSLPDLLLVFGQATLEQPAIAALPSGYRSRLILVERGKGNPQEHPQISYPLVSSRVLQALDRLTCANEEYPTAEPAGADQGTDNDSRYAKYVAQSRPPRAVTSGSPARDYRVLVVDDSTPMQRALEAELRQQFGEITIDFADDGHGALQQVDGTPYDFIFLDIMMPGIDGFETCSRMRQKAALKKTPIIMLSSKTSPLDEVKGIMAGSSTYLTKPIETVEFQKVMGRIGRWVDDFSRR